jgi:hypothetical protein
MTSSCCSDPYHAAQKNINENTLAENEARCNALKRIADPSTLNTFLLEPIIKTN